MTQNSKDKEKDNLFSFTPEEVKELQKQKKAWFEKEINALDGRDLKLTIGLMSEPRLFKITAKGRAVNNKRIDFYISIPLGMDTPFEGIIEGTDPPIRLLCVSCIKQISTFDKFPSQ